MAKKDEKPVVVTEGMLRVDQLAARDQAQAWILEAHGAGQSRAFTATAFGRGYVSLMMREQMDFDAAVALLRAMWQSTIVRGLNDGPKEKV